MTRPKPVDVAGSSVVPDYDILVGHIDGRLRQAGDQLLCCGFAFHLPKDFRSRQARLHLRNRRKRPRFIRRTTAFKLWCSTQPTVSHNRRYPNGAGAAASRHLQCRNIRPNGITAKTAVGAGNAACAIADRLCRMIGHQFRFAAWFVCQPACLKQGKTKDHGRQGQNYRRLLARESHELLNISRACSQSFAICAVSASRLSNLASPRMKP